MAFMNGRFLAISNAIRLSCAERAGDCSDAVVSQFAADAGCAVYGSVNGINGAITYGRVRFDAFAGHFHRHRGRRCDVNSAGRMEAN